MISVVIADDEPLSRHRLRQHLAYVEGVSIVAECAEGREVVRAVDALRPDLLFLDVRMPGWSGIEVLRRIRHKPAVVFTTAYDRYAVTAFELQAVDYLLKPFGRNRLDAALQRVRMSLGRDDAVRHINRAVVALDVDVRPDRIYVRERGNIIPIDADDVTRIEARDDYVMIHAGELRQLASVRMRDLESQLDPRRFLRIHRSHIVNVDHVKTIASHTSGRLQVTMQDGTQLFASRSRSQAIRHLTL